jgi:hypothetical protein
LYVANNSNEFSPEEKEIIRTRFSDELMRTVLVRFYSDAGTDPSDLAPELPDPPSDLRDYWMRVRVWMRRNEPSLAGLSDQELDLALNVAIGMDLDAAHDPALPPSFEWMTKSKTKPKTKPKAKPKTRRGQ